MTHLTIKMKVEVVEGVEAQSLSRVRNVEKRT